MAPTQEPTDRHSSAPVAHGSPLQGFYSPLERALLSLNTASASPEQWIGTLQNLPSVRREELEWSGLIPWLQHRNGPTSRDTLLAYLRAHRLELREVIKTGSGDHPQAVRYAAEQLAGGSRYREVLLLAQPTVAQEEFMALEQRAWSAFERGDTDQGRSLAHARNMLTLVGGGPLFRSIHFDEANVLAHLRLNERAGADGERVLFIEELQSDWHAAGRERGYDASEQYDFEEAFDLGLTPEQNRRGVPPAPFRRTWPLLAIKQCLRLAVEEGFDSVAWTPGAIQIERYGLDRQVDGVDYHFVPHSGDGKGQLRLSFHEKLVFERRAAPDELSKWLGPTISDQILSERTREGYCLTRLRGLDFRTGGLGLQSFYDVHLRNEVARYVGRWGTDVEPTLVAAGAAQISAAGVRITDSMRASLGTGQALFCSSRTDAFLTDSGRARAMLDDTRDMQLLRSALARQLRMDFDRQEIRLAAPDAAQLAVADAVAAAFNKRVLYFDTSARVARLHGVGLTEGTATLFVHARSMIPAMVIAGHELVHRLRVEHPGLYDQLEEQVMRRCWNPLVHRAPSPRREELVADLVGEHLVRPSFWHDFHQDAPTLARQILNAASETIGRLWRAVRGRLLPGATHFVETRRLSRDIGYILRQYAERQAPAPAPSPVVAMTAPDDAPAMT